MMNDKVREAYRIGFMKRAQEYGMTQMQAKVVFEKKASIPSDLSSWLGHHSTDLTPEGRYIPAEAAQDLLPVLGGYAGVGLGGLTGAMIPSRDEKGETHRLRNAITGAGIGGLGGAGLGALGSGAIMADPTSYETAAGAEGLKDLANKGIRPLTDIYKAFTR